MNEPSSSSLTLIDSQSHSDSHSDSQSDSDSQSQSQSQSELFKQSQSQSQSELFKQFKQFTLPLFGLLPFDPQNQNSSQILLQLIISLSHLLHIHSHLLSQKLIHYISIPISLLLQDLNLLSIPQLPFDNLLVFSFSLFSLPQINLSSPPWIDIRTHLSLAIIPILSSNSLPPKSHHSISLAINLLNLLLFPPSLHSLSDPPSLPPHSITFIFNHLAPIIQSLSQAHLPSQARAQSTLNFVHASLSSLSHSSLPDASGLRLLSTILPRSVSLLTKLIIQLAPRRGFAPPICTALHLIDWLLVESFDDQLPDLHDLLLSPDPESESDPDSHPDLLPDVRALVFQLASHSNHSHPIQLTLSPPLQPNTGPLVERTKQWLLQASTNIATLLALLSDCLSTHPHPAVHDAWLRLCARLLSRCGSLLRLAPPPAPPLPQRNAFTLALDALLSARASLHPVHDPALPDVSHALTHASRAAPAAYTHQITALLVADLQKLALALINQTPGQDIHIVQLATRLVSALDLLIDLFHNNLSCKLLYQTCLDSLYQANLHTLLPKVFARIRLAVPKLFDPSSSHSHEFPRLSLINMSNQSCVDAIEKLVGKATQLLLLACQPGSGVSEMRYFVALLDLATASGDSKSTNFELSALWIFVESLRAAKSLATDPHTATGRARFTRLIGFGIDALQRLIEGEKRLKPEGSGEAEANGLLLDGIEEQVTRGYLKGNDRLFALEGLRPVALVSIRAEEEEEMETLGTCLLLRLAAAVGVVCEEALVPSLSWLLYFVLGARRSESAYVCSHAEVALEVLAFRCGYGSVTNMVADNADYLLNGVAAGLLPNAYDSRAVGVLEQMIRRVGLDGMLPGLEEVLLEDCCWVLDEHHVWEDGVCEEVLGLFRVVMSMVKREVVVGQARIGEEEALTVMAQDEDEVFEAELEMDRARRALAGPLAGCEADLESFEMIQRARVRMKEARQRERGAEDDQRAPEGPFSGMRTVEQEDNQEEEGEVAMTVHERLAAGMMDKASYFLCHGSLVVRSLVSEILRDGIGILCKGEKKVVVPIVKRIWMTMISRIGEGEGGGGGGGRELIELKRMGELLKEIIKCVGMFIRSKQIDEEIWPRLKKMIMNRKRMDLKGVIVVDEDEDVGLEILKEIILSFGGESGESGGGDGVGKIRCKESVVWEMIVCLLSQTYQEQEEEKEKRFSGFDQSEMIKKKENKKNTKLEEEIIELLKKKGFEGSIWVAQKAFVGEIEGMEFMMRRL